MKVWLSRALGFMGTPAKGSLCIRTRSVNHQVIQTPRRTPGAHNPHVTFVIKHKSVNVDVTS